MQLNANGNGGSIRNQLALAVGSLLATPPQAEAVDVTSPWEIDAGSLYYTEGSDRVSLFELAVLGTWRLGDELTATAQVVFDSLTGATPNGAVATDEVQTFTRPSGSHEYDTAANEQPLDDSFRDTRVALKLVYGHPVGEDLHLHYGLNASNEYDYRSIGLDFGVDWDLWQRTSTLSVSVGAYFDQVEPVGGVPEGLAVIPDYPRTKPTTGGTDDKLVLDLLVGWTQVLTPNSLLKANLVLGQDDGYLSDPYKLLSVVDPVTGETQRYVTEERPDSKTRWAAYLAYQQLFGDDVLRLSYRYYGDDWGVDSHTLDAHYRWQFLSRHFVEPHLRLYLQSAADFYHTSLTTDETPSEASADYRLADMTAYTIGATYGFDINPTNQLRLSVETYQQESEPSRVIGVQKQQNLSDELSVLMIRGGYTLQW